MFLVCVFLFLFAQSLLVSLGRCVWCCLLNLVAGMFALYFASLVAFCCFCYYVITIFRITENKFMMMIILEILCNFIGASLFNMFLTGPSVVVENASFLA